MNFDCNYNDKLKSKYNLITLFIVERLIILYNWKAS